ncbi:hypothetical protein EII17_11680 [Clostridiales bacterium COT073_COT-073]|nr:hypothetical protein EII17_11680 [Clostridiales bacterium COT073_COT-073]
MLKIWGKLMKNHLILRDAVLEYESAKNRAGVVKESLSDFAIALDIARPIWLPKNDKELSKFIVTTFYPDQFMESVDFDCLVIEIIGDEKKRRH